MIHVKQITKDGFVIVIDGSLSIKRFKEIVHRATNLWPDAPAEVKRFADAITNSDWHLGPLQDYDSQDTSSSAPQLSPLPNSK
jgi:hypothetical protein